MWSLLSQKLDCGYHPSIHPFSSELSLNHELEAYVVLSQHLMGKLQAAAGSVSRHLPSLHVDPGICRLVRWLSHVWLSSSICTSVALLEDHLEVLLMCQLLPKFPLKAFHSHTAEAHRHGIAMVSANKFSHHDREKLHTFNHWSALKVKHLYGNC